MTAPTPAEALKAEDDAPENYEVSRLPLLLREHVDMVLACEAEPHVIEDARAIVAQAADFITGALAQPPSPTFLAENAQNSLTAADAGEVRTYREGVESEWQEIETAPKDGTDILVWSYCYTDPTTYGGMFIAWWADIHAPDSEYGTVQHEAHWCWCTEIDGKNGPAKVRSQPTHWRPLPTPPAAAIRKLP